MSSAKNLHFDIPWICFFFLLWRPYVVDSGLEKDPKDLSSHWWKDA